MALLSLSCGRHDSQPVAVGSTPSPPPVAAFTDVTTAAGVHFVHHNGKSERRYLPETMGAGVAVFDVDGDHRPDLYFVGGAPVADAAEGPSGMLYHNRGDGTFEDITEASGLGDTFLGMGAAVGDIDNDGDLDLFVTAVGRDRLYRNDGAGRFVEVGDDLGLGAKAGFGSSATFVDVDRDGWLDLFAGRYVEWSRARDVRCSPDGNLQTYCTPEVYSAVSSRLYRNLGGRGFEDVTVAAGIDIPGKALGVVALDYDDDGWPDLAIANDTVRNFLFHNQGDGTFHEVAVEEGIAFSPSGSTRGGMGIDAGDVDGDGTDELAIGNFSQEMSALYRSHPPGPYLDEAARLGVGIPSLLTLAFGTLLVDYDADGWLDLVLVNGHIEPEIARYQPNLSYAQPAALFRNLGGTRGFVPVAETGDLFEPLVARGLASGDLDGDGDLDLVVTQNGRGARIFRNDTPARSWIGIRLTGSQSNRSGYGARISVVARDREIHRSLVSGRSYLSASDPELRVGLGDAEAVDRVVVQWPSGRRQTVTGPAIGQVLEIVEPVDRDAAP